MPDVSPTTQYRLVETGDGRWKLSFDGPVDVSSATPLIESLPPALQRKHPRHLTVSLGGVTHFDDFGALLLFHVRHTVDENGGEFQLADVPSQVGEILTMVNFVGHKKCLAPSRNRPLNVIVRLGAAILDEIQDFRFTFSFLGDLILSLGRILHQPRTLRWSDCVDHMETTGVDAVPIVGMISFLVGLIMAFMAAVQLRQFGADIYVAALVALSVVPEMGPIMTAIVVAGRSGSAYAAEISTMQISEEIDALQTMGFDPVHFLVLPRVTAALLMVPLLSLFANLFALAGGMLVSVAMLDITAGGYVSKTIESLSLADLLWGLFKSAIFAFLISWVSCLRGFQARGGAAAVGRAATSAVVSSIFLIILFDSLFAVVRNYW